MRETEPKPKNGGSLLKRTAFYAVISFAICFVVLGMVNHSIVFGDNSADDTSAAVTQSTITGVPKDAKNISFSHDDKYCTYLYDSKLYVMDMTADKTIDTIKDTGITWAQLMYDRNTILYFTQSSTALALRTYSIDNGTSTKQLSFKIASGSKIKDVDYSNATNMVYINLETKKDGSTKDTIYSINIMKKLQKVSTGKIVDNMVLLNDTGSLYIEDGDNMLYNRVSSAEELQSGHLIGCDSQDRVYVQSVDDKSKISVLSGEDVVKTLTLPDTDYLEFYSDKSNVYVIYSDYIINLSGDMSARFTYSPDLNFIGLGGSKIYFWDSNGTVTGIPSSIAS